MKRFPPITYLRMIGLGSLSSLIALINWNTIVLATTNSFRDSPKAVVDEAWQIVNQEYVDPQFNHVDWLQIRHQLLSKSYTSSEEAYTALRDALKLLNDPYTRFLTPPEFQALDSEAINGDLIGIGVQIQADPQTKLINIAKVIAASPALHAGLQSGDTILAIDGHPTQGMPVDAVIQLIRGRENSAVHLMIRRSYLDPFMVAVARKKIELPIVSSAIREQNGQRIGYIHLDEFNGHSAEQMRKAILSLEQQHVDRYVLDLRGNPGGRLDQETKIAQMWLNNAVLVKIVDRQGDSEIFKAQHSALTHQPLAVLVDGNSASASEILTGSLKDNHRAIIIGTQTFGKALVQSVNKLSDGSGINVTVAHYLTPAGLDINHRGITPDVVLPLTDTQLQELSTHPDEIGTPLDPQYQRAVSLLSRQ